jgi:transcription elongation GreA/GreB family factor
MIKNELLAYLNNALTININQLKKDIQSLYDSRNNDTKSSAGNKYETSREMAQIELNKLEAQLNKTNHIKNELSKIDINIQHKKVEFGALIKTNKESFFISIPYGKIEINNEIYYAISPASPIGIALLGKEIGNKFEFMGSEYWVVELN